MTFKELINKYTWNEIANAFFKLYPDQIKNIEGYDNIYLELQTKRPKKSTLMIYIDSVEEDEEIYFDVYGKNIDDETKYALELSSVSEWLGYIISPQLLKKMSEIDIICQCLYEITFHGYSNKEIVNYHPLKRDGL